MNYSGNQCWWNSYKINISNFRKDDTLNNVQGYFTISDLGNLAHLPYGHGSEKTLAEVIVEHYKKAFGIHVEYRNVSAGSRRHPYTITQLDCHVVSAPKWLHKNDDGTYAITSVIDYLTTCNIMIESVCKECAKNHLNVNKLFRIVSDEHCFEEQGYSAAFPFGIDCERMVKEREEEERKREAIWNAYRERYDKCDELCREKLKSVINNIQDIYNAVKQEIVTAEVEERVFYWDSYCRHDGYQITMNLPDDIIVQINALKCKQYSSKIDRYELSDSVSVSYEYEDCKAYKKEFNVLRDLILSDKQLVIDIVKSMGIPRFESQYPENVSIYVRGRW